MMKLTRYRSSRLCFFGGGGGLALPEGDPVTVVGGTPLGREEAPGAVAMLGGAEPLFVDACGLDTVASDFVSA